MQNIKTRIYLSILVAAFVISITISPGLARVSPPELKEKQTGKPAIVFLVAGQSNAGGCGVFSPQLHEKLGRHVSRPLVPGSTAKEVGLSTDAADYTHSYIWVPGKGLQRTNPDTNIRAAKPGIQMHGMELPVIAELEKRFPENDIYVVKYGPGATNLHHDWDPQRTNGKYAVWLGYYRKAMAQLRKEYPQVRVVGLYWDQGESDGIDKKHTEYTKNLTDLIAAVRRDTGVPQLKVFIRKHIFNWPNIDVIIAAQEKVVKDDPRCYLLDIDLGNRKANYQAWAYSPGNGHVSSKGFVELTKRLFSGPLRNATIESFDNSDIVKTKIDWRSFLARHDMIWKRLPGNWRQAPWTGNGMLGSMCWVKDDALRLQVFRGDVQAHRPMTQGTSGFTRARLQIGSFYLKPQAAPVDCDLRLSLYDAEVAGTVAMDKGELKIRQFTHSEDMVIVTELQSADGDAPVSLSWKPASSMPTRHGYAKTEADFPRVRKQYISKYPTEVFHPNPDPVIKVVNGVNVCIQDMLGGSRHVTAWKMIKTGVGKQRLAVSIANRWPKKNNDPLAEAVKAVSKVCAMDANAYDAWKQKHYDWWHSYYPAAFLSVPDTEVETVYWTTMYKLGSATRSDRVMIDTAGIWQTPSKWADSHWDFNIPYCYYPMPTANRVELGNSLIRTFNKYQDNLVKNVRPVEWQKDSSYLPVTTGHDLYQPKDVDDRCFQNTGGHLVWGMHACWLIYRGSMDDEVLRDTIYPIMKRAANYQIHRLVKRNGKYHAPVSHSPEYGDAPDANYELSMLRWICHAIVASGTRLGVEDAELTKYRDILANLADYPVDERGYMVGEGMSFNKPHRHWCHLQMMHPLQLVTGKTPQERDLMVRSMNNFDKVNRKSGAAAFTFNGLSAMWALLGDGDRALHELHRFMKWPNLCANSMYQEGNNPCFESPVYAAHNVHELLVQCYDEFPGSGQMQATIRVFPAVPSKWSDAVFHNLRTAGAFLVSAERKDGRTQWVRVKSLAGEPCRIKPNFPGPVHVSGDRKFSLKDLGDGIYELDLKQGEEVLLYSGDTAPKPAVAPLPAQNERCNRYGLK